MSASVSVSRLRRRIAPVVVDPLDTLALRTAFVEELLWHTDFCPVQHSMLELLEMFELSLGTDPDDEYAQALAWLAARGYTTP